MVNILLLEDEDYTRRFLKKLVSNNTDKVFDTSSGKEAINLAVKHKPGIALLDIELAPEEELNGIQVAKAIYEFNPATYFVFITGYSQYAIESFAVHPYDYILKPVKKDKVSETIKNLAGKIEKRNGNSSSFQKIMLKVKDERIMLSPGDILFIEKQDKNTLVHTGGGIYKTRQTMEEFEKQLGGKFLRVHRSFIVNMDKISKIREVSNRSYEIDFGGYDRVALMSRYKLEEHKHILTPL